MSLYLGVDLGTQSVKVLVFDSEKSKVIARGSHEVPAQLGHLHRGSRGSFL